MTFTTGMLPPARIGMAMEEIDTPALILDIVAFERNLDRMATEVTSQGLHLRPHAKTHRCPAIALQQISRGAVGICCQKVAEAEAMRSGGVCNILITNEIIEPAKLLRLANLAKHADISVCVDHLDQVERLADAASALSARIKVLVEVNVGGNRCGVAPGAPAVKLARRVLARRNWSSSGYTRITGRPSIYGDTLTGAKLSKRALKRPVPRSWH